MTRCKGFPANSFQELNTVTISKIHQRRFLAVTNRAWIHVRLFPNLVREGLSTIYPGFSTLRIISSRKGVEDHKNQE